MIDEPVDLRGKAEASSGLPAHGRAGRLFSGWSANLAQMVLGITQQVALVPIFLHYWSGDTLAAWFVLYAIGNLAFMADAGLQFRAINRFLGLKSCADGDGRTARFYAAMLRTYLVLVAALTVPLLIGASLLAPSTVFGFATVPHFDAAFIVMAVGMLWTVPSNLVGALYRAGSMVAQRTRRTFRLRAVWPVDCHCGVEEPVGRHGRLRRRTTVAAVWLLAIDAPGCSRITVADPRHSWVGLLGNFSGSLCHHGGY